MFRMLIPLLLMVVVVVIAYVVLTDPARTRAGAQRKQVSREAQVTAARNEARLRVADERAATVADGVVELLRDPALNRVDPAAGRDLVAAHEQVTHTSIAAHEASSTANVEAFERAVAEAEQQIARLRGQLG